MVGLCVLCQYFFMTVFYIPLLPRSKGGGGLGGLEVGVLYGPSLLAVIIELWTGDLVRHLS